MFNKIREYLFEKIMTKLAYELYTFERDYGEPFQLKAPKA